MEVNYVGGQISRALGLIVFRTINYFKCAYYGGPWNILLEYTHIENAIQNVSLSHTCRIQKQ